MLNVEEIASHENISTLPVYPPVKQNDTSVDDATLPSHAVNSTDSTTDSGVSVSPGMYLISGVRKFPFQPTRFCLVPLSGMKSLNGVAKRNTFCGTENNTLDMHIPQRNGSIAATFAATRRRLGGKKALMKEIEQRKPKEEWVSLQRGNRGGKATGRPFHLVKKLMQM